MRLALAPAEKGDPGGKGAGGEDPMREAEAGAVIERGPCSSRLTQGSCVQGCLSHDMFPSKKEARHQAEGMGGAESKEFDLTQDIQHDTSNVISGSRIQEYQGSSFIEKCISLEPWNARPLEPF